MAGLVDAAEDQHAAVVAPAGMLLLMLVPFQHLQQNRAQSSEALLQCSHARSLMTATAPLVLSQKPPPVFSALSNILCLQVAASQGQDSAHCRGQCG